MPAGWALGAPCGMGPAASEMIANDMEIDGPMRPLLASYFAITLLLVLPGTAHAQTATRVCGTMSEYRAPTASMPGSITVDPEKFSIDSRATIDVGADVRVGSAVCMTGTWIMSQTVGRTLTELQVRVQVASATPSGTQAPSTAGSAPSTLPATQTDKPASAPLDPVLGVVGAGVLVVALILTALFWRRANT